MRIKTIRTLLTALVFVAILGFALREVQMTRAATAQLASALGRQGDLQAELRKTEKLLAEASRHRSDLNNRLAMLQAAKKDISSYEGERRILAELGKPWREIVLCKDPRLQAMYLQSERTAIPERYAAFVSALGLSPDQAGKLEAAIMADTERNLDIKASAQTQSLDSSNPGVAALLNQSDDELKTALTDLLGADGYSQLQDYQRTLPTREFVNTLAGELAFTDSPLDGQQANLLVGMLSSANSSYQNGGIAVSPRLQDYNSLMATQSLAQAPVAWDSIKSQAQVLLNAAQFSLLNAMMQNNSSTVQLYNMVTQASPAPLLGFSYTRKSL